jgi:hypothetical protein
MQSLRVDCDRIRAHFEKSKENIKKIQTVIRYKPITHLVRPEDLSSDDEPTEEERFLLNLNQVRSKIAHIWRKSQNTSFDRRQGKEVRIKNLDSGPTPKEEENDEFTR